MIDLSNYSCDKCAREFSRHYKHCWHTEQNNLGLALRLNKTNYAKICKHAQKVFEDFYRELDIDYSDQWEKYC